LLNDSDRTPDEKIGEIVQVRLKTGEVIRGFIIEKTAGGFRLADSMVSGSSKDPSAEMIPFPGFIEIKRSSIESFQVITQAP